MSVIRASIVGNHRTFLPNWIFRIGILALLANYCIADPANIELGDSLDKLIEFEGKATRVSVLTMKDKIFITHFYQESNISYVIDEESGMICEITLGETEGYCYPCDYGPSAGTCP